MTMAAVDSPLLPDGRVHADRLLERLLRLRRDRRTRSSAAATGATSNPVIVGEVMKKERDHWVPRLRELLARAPGLVRGRAHLGADRGDGRPRRARSCEPVFDANGGRKGRLSLQTNPANYRSAGADGRAGASTSAPSRPTSRSSSRAPPRASRPSRRRPPAASSSTSRSCSPSPSASPPPRPWSVACAGSRPPAATRRRMGPVCTLMVGRLDDWVKTLVERDGIALDPDAANWAGIAAFKRTYALFRERGYRTRLLAAAYRHRLHWTELVGADVVLTIPHAWQVRFNDVGHRARARGSTSPWTRTSSTTC